MRNFDALCVIWQRFRNYWKLGVFLYQRGCVFCVNRSLVDFKKSLINTNAPPETWGFRTINLYKMLPTNRTCKNLVCTVQCSGQSLGDRPQTRGHWSHIYELQALADCYEFNKSLAFERNLLHYGCLYFALSYFKVFKVNLQVPHLVTQLPKKKVAWRNFVVEYSRE